MERQKSNLLQNFDDSKSDILKKRLLKSATTTVNSSLSQNISQHNVLLNTLRVPTSGSMIVSSVQASQSSMPITHNLVTHSLAPVKIHTTTTYPLQLSTVHVPVQIPGSNSNINVPVQLSGQATSVPLQITPVSLPIQVSGTTNVPVQLPAGETINVPLQLPGGNQNIQLTGSTLPSMPILQNTSQSLSSIFHVHMGSNPRQTNMETSDMANTTQLQLSDQVKINTSTSQVTSQTMVQIPSSSNNSIQLTLPNSVSTGVQLRGSARPVPHMVYIQTQTGLKPVTNTEVISQASTSGNPPQIIVRRPVPNNNNIHLISNINKPNIAPKIAQKTSLLAPANAGQPIVIQKPKPSDKMMVPVSIAPGTQGKQAIAYLGSVKKGTKSESQSILISNNQNNTNNQKLFLTPMNMPKMQNTKFILPVTLPATMASKGPIINLQIANGQIQNDPQGNITVMRDTSSEGNEMPPLQPLGKVNVNGKDVPQTQKSDKSFTVSIQGSRAEPTGEKGEYTLSIPETNASMNDDIYTVSIADEDGGQREKSFTLAIPEKSKSLLNKNIIDRNDVNTATIAAPAILRRSNSDNYERKTTNLNLKRRISLCNENLVSKSFKLTPIAQEKNDKIDEQVESENNDDHRVPSLFCDEKLDKDLDTKTALGDSDCEDYKEAKPDNVDKSHDYYQSFKKDSEKLKRESIDSNIEEDPPGLIWNNGIALLQGSNLHFQSNEFGLIDLIDLSDNDDIIMPSTKYQTPLKQRIERGSVKKPTSPEDLYRCDGCGCHGMAAEFITPNFCSVTCQNEVQKIEQKKKDRERRELLKKRNNMKRLISIKRKPSESDIILDGKESLKSYDLGEPQLSDVSLLKINEDLIENEKYPWMCGKNGFSWMRYLEVCKAKSVPLKCFKEPFPYVKNGFKVGMRMEAIDPDHPSYFCVVSVTEVQGYRMRLHFDEYPDLYDYWVNADSIDIFPAGWCEKNNRSLKPPAGHSATNFSWPMYLKQMHAIAAPKHLFAHTKNSVIKPNGFRIGMKLEAEDRKNNLICVATIKDILDNRLLINFDSWDEMYDYWVDPTSPFIHPVGWAEENELALTPPNYFKDPDTFSWDSYLEDQGALPAPPRAFKTRPPMGYKAGMKLEAVDPRVPFLIRVASITDVKSHQLLVSFDGWGEEYDVWMDDDSPDLHPVGWCLKTQHPLEPPLTSEDLQILGPCGVAGCRGLGSSRGGSHKHHNSASTCPYRPCRPYRRIQPDKPPRIQPHSDTDVKRVPISSRLPKPTITSTPTSESKENTLPKRGRPPKHKRVEEVSSKNEMSEDESISNSSCGKRSRATLDHVARLSLGHDPAVWTQSDVAALLTRIAGTSAGSAALSAHLTGAELLMCSKEELVQCLQLRLGPAVKVHSAVRELREHIA